MTTVLDASALLAFLVGERGSDRVSSGLADGVVGAANWSETSQKILAHDGDWQVARAVLESYGVRVEPVTTADAERAAEQWSPGSLLSLGDRLCLALADRLEAPVLTADRDWGNSGRIVQIR
jgi:PIN domain nuclease of toxin-antitoxin system